MIASPPMISDIVISPDSETIAAVYKDKATVMLWDIKGKMVAKI